MLQTSVLLRHYHNSFNSAEHIGKIMVGTAGEGILIILLDNYMNKDQWSGAVMNYGLLC